MPDLFKLEKLRVEAFDNVGRQGLPQQSFEAMFNPSSYAQGYGVVWSEKRGINTSGSQASYIRSEPATLSFDLLIDGTGVRDSGLAAPFRKTVSERIDQFRRTAYTYNGVIHQPNYLLVSWGKLWFSCRLEKLDIEYDLFQRDGTPLRAKLSVTFFADEDDQKRNLKKNNSSPDLTHIRTVRRGDTLPRLVREIYGSTEPYLRVARANGLDHFRWLEPGSELLFPPLDQLPPAPARPQQEAAP